jgi:hypothetical protein
MDKWKRAPSAPYETDAIEGQPKRVGCAEGTRLGVLEHILAWVIDDKSPPIFWLSGMAGTGKSAIAFTICKLLDEINRRKLSDASLGASLGASFFCSRQVGSLRRRQNIIPMIAYQLACHSHSFAEELGKADHNAIDTSSRQVEELLVTPWKASVENRPAPLPLTLIVIDALDEIEDDGGEKLLKELIQVAEQTARDDMRGFKILVTSRPHPSIVDATDLLPRDSVYRLEEIEAEDGRKDIMTYLCGVLPLLSLPDHDNIADHAQGLFIYAATIARALSGQTQQEQQDTLALILSDSQQTPNLPNPLMAIDALYKQVLATNFEDRYISRLVVLRCIICALQPLPISTIARIAAEAVGGVVDEEATRRLVVENLYSFLYISQRDSCVYIYHKSFSDFLLDIDRSGPKFACDQNVQHAAISMACFRIMQASLRFNMCSLPSSYLFDSEVKGVAGVALDYACRYWTSHRARVSIDSKDSQPLRSKLLEFSQEKILYWFEVMNLLVAKTDGYAGVNAVMTWVNKQVGILPFMTLS